ncbi:Retrovirus-related Pol polyprotein from transposon opus [Trichinella pseudospiralis]|uniref:Retrovirus-related Pol polyprotein from transposon opus n=1 Tax=Trichinella pseudospiralis TaxID=6337 RepID=A0A0V1G440_TRIPS|nr:Retrovirus-related Pol polyprotein from transposon opus [Trichinella pseudospiralis]
MRPQDILKSVITTLFGLFEFLKMPFSLRNAAQNFQRFIDTVTRCFVYVDDFLASVSQKEYMKKVLQRLQAHGIQVNKGSCILAAPSLPFLGQIVDTNGITKSKRSKLFRHPQPGASSADLRHSKFLQALPSAHRDHIGTLVRHRIGRSIVQDHPHA